MATFMFEKKTLAQRMKDLDIDIAMDGCFNKPSTVAYPQKKGHELYIVAGWRNNQPNHVVGANKIKSLEQLRGKRIGVIDVDDILVTALRPWLKRAGVDPYNDVTWVRGNAPHEARARLRAGTIDAAFHAQRGSGRLSDRHSDLRKSLGERLLKLRRAEKRRGKSMERVFHQDEFRI
jgi:ABC-type taurine transport system substrate-binding protein